MTLPTIQRRRRRPRFRTRPFFISTALILALVSLYTFVPSLAGIPRADSSTGHLGLVRRDDAPEDLECRLVHYAEDKCAFVKANCEDEAAGLLPYIEFYYCSMQHAQPVAFAILVVWLGLLFTTIGIAASDFFSVNLGTIASILGLSESLAGVTFLAFGNGSPDVFSTFAAMGSNSGSMAVGELIGAAGFITGVVAGSMALVREFKVSRRTFVRDICFFIASVAFAMLFLADGSLVLWECCVMIGFYVFYVLTVVGWHWVSSRRKKRRAREAASRGHFYGATIGAMGSSGAADDDLAPYHDEVPAQPNENGEIDPHDEPEPDDTAPVGGRRERPPPDISALERGPRIEVDSVENPGEADLAFDAEAQDHEISEEEQDRRNRHITAEMTSSMRVNLPRGRRRTTATTPIRPSLLGALEFRSVLASLQRSGTMHLAPIDRRRLSYQHPPGLSRGYSVSSLGGSGTQDPNGLENTRGSEDNMSRSSLLPQDGYRGVDGRDRAFSSGDRPFSWADDAPQLGPPLLRYTDAEDPTPGDPAPGDSAAGTASSSLGPSPLGGSAHTSAFASPDAAGAMSPTQTPLASPPTHPHSSHSQQHPSRVPPGAGSGLHLHIPASPQHGARLSPQLSPALSPFPGYTESPMPFSSLPPSLPPSRTPSFPLLQPGDAPADDGSNFPGLDDNADIHKPIKWWPYNTLPAPHIIINTLFPSLIGWREKTIWDKFVSLISAPTVLLLVVTLPVVEMDIPCDDDDEEELLAHEYEDGDVPAADGDDGVHVPLIDGSHDSSSTASEWQRYRRSTLTNRPVPLPAIAAIQDEAARLGTDTMSSAAVTLASAGASSSSGTTPAAAHVPAVPSTLPNPPAKPMDPAHFDVVGRGGGSSGPSKAETEAGVTNGGWNRWLVAVQVVAGPLFTVFVVWANMAEDLERPRRDLVVMVLASLVASCIMLAVLLSTTTAQRRPDYHSSLCFLGFVISVAWISTVAGEVVGVLKAFGVIVGISEAILGLTIFAVGNSLGDLVADITVARLGYPVMALAACFGGPMLNILLGVGIGGAWMTVKAARDRSDKHPDQPLHYEPYAIQVGSSLLVSAVTVLVTLVFLLIAVPANRWVMSRKIGLALIGMWTVSTIINVVLEVVGAW
ncbi:hypothetical protein SCUCBS95973_008601 [Sporothrix curviconia]|uniref:Sodium/calcium exchanger membrane region domain-containing protein n=1 Tax=Sporothrix curviconia TaxID=1260050 RepID=A0ABP0CMY5_9PEZI